MNIITLWGVTENNEHFSNKNKTGGCDRLENSKGGLL